jgi:hypothetical protein
MKKSKKPLWIVVVVIVLVVLLSASIALNRQVKSLSEKLSALVSTGPQITNQVYINVTQTKATILWDTDRIATTQISLGTSASNLTLLNEYNTPASQNGSISHRYDLAQLTPCTRYYFRLISSDTAGNKTTSATYSLDTRGCGQSGGDVTAPAPVTNFRVVSSTPTSVTLAWDRATDPSGIYRYYIFGGNGDMGNRQQLAIVSGSLTNFTIENLTAGATYSGEYGSTAGFMIQAVDNANNFSEPSGRLTVVMPALVSNVAPTTTTSAVTGWWTNSQISIPLTCTPGSGTTCTATYYKYISSTTASCPSADPTTYTQGTTAVIVDQGLYDLCFWSQGSNSVRETPRRIGPFGIDKTKPTGQITYPTANLLVQGVMTVTTSAADALSGVQRVLLSVDSKPPETVSIPPYSFTVDTGTLTEGSHNLIITVYDNAGNQSSSSRIYFTVERCDTLLTNRSTFSSTLNPTGNPIGGGKCYRSIINRSSANRIVATRADLISALAQATPGQTIYVDDSAVIDLTGSAPLTIPGGVTLASGRGKSGSQGALLYSNSYYSSDVPLFTTGGNNVRLTGLRIRGPYEGIGDHDYSAGYALAFKNNHSNTEIDNNEFWAWQKWAIWLYKIGGSNNQNGARIHHNYFHDTMNNGYGYHIWVGGAGSESNVLATIEGNLFGSSREVVDAHSGAHSYTFTHNVVMDNHLYRNVLRHGGSECPGLRGLSGDVTKIIENLFFTQDDMESVTIGTPRTATGSYQVIGNWFQVSNPANQNEIPAYTGLCDASTATFSELLPSQAQTRDSRVIISGNYINAQGRSLPVASFTASSTSPTEGQTVTFDASASSDPSGTGILHYRWRFADGEGAFAGGSNDLAYRANERWDVKTTSYTFAKPGYYDVELVVFNAYGIPSEKTYKKIYVQPSPSRGQRVLTAWVKDSYDRNAMPGRYEQQLVLFDVSGNTLTNPIVVWRKDVNGVQGWTQAVVNLDTIPNLTLAGRQKAVGYRLIAVGQPTGPQGVEGELWTWVDNMYVFGSVTKIQDPGFEIDGGPTSPWRAQVNNMSSMFVHEMMRGGESSFRLRYGDGTAPIGTASVIYQTIQF